MDLPNGVKPHIFKKDENLYFLTCHPDMIQYDRLHLEPRIPYRRGNGENNCISRVCLGNRLYRILKAVPIIWNDEDYQFYFTVYRAIGYNPEAIVEPDNTLVRDVKATDELWSLEPVDLKKIGKLQILDAEECFYKDIINGVEDRVGSRKNISWKWIDKPTEKVRIK